MKSVKENVRFTLFAAAAAETHRQRQLAEQPELSDPERQPSPVEIADEPLLTVDEIAARRGVTRNAILDAIRRGTLAAHKLYLPHRIPHTFAYYVTLSEVERSERDAALPPRPMHRSVAVEKQARADGYLTMGEVRRMLGVSRSRLDYICRRKTNRLPRQKINGTWFISRVDAQCEVDSRTLKALQNLPQSD